LSGESDSRRDKRLESLELANAAHLQNAAIRALDDPVALARAARIVRVALERRRLTVADLTPDPAARPDCSACFGTGEVHAGKRTPEPCKLCAAS
jgi:hypothetical protein